MTDEERAARGGRDRRKRNIAEEAKRTWSTRAESFERLGQRMIEYAARAKLVTTRANGPQMHPKFKAGLELLEAADKLWARVHRVGGPPPKGGEDKPASPEPKPPSLGEYSASRPDARE